MTPTTKGGTKQSHFSFGKLGRSHQQFWKRKANCSQAGTVSNCDTVLFPVELFTPWLILPTPQSKELWSLPIFFCFILSSQKADRLSSLWEREWISVGVRLKVKQMSHILLLFLTSTEVMWLATFVHTNLGPNWSLTTGLMDLKYRI